MAQRRNDHEQWARQQVREQERQERAALAAEKASEREQTITMAGTVLGVYRDLDVPEHELRLGPGDALVLYTDGVIEARGSDGFYGTDRLRTLLSSCAGTQLDEIADTLLADVLAFQDGHARDDIALMLLRARP